MAPAAPVLPRAAPRVGAVDGLRGLAVALVVLFHVWQASWLDYTKLLHSPVDLSFLPAMGFFGVDLFFFLSAFCLTLPYARHYLCEGDAPTLRHYFGRRAAKILPSYWFALLLLLLLRVDSGIPADRLLFHVAAHLLFVHNLFFDTTNSIGGVMWSLATEVQFYFLLPLLLPVFRRAPLPTVAALVVVALAWRAGSFQRNALHPDDVSLVWSDTQLLARLDTFAAGMGAAYLFAAAQGRAWVARAAPAFAALAVAGLAALLGLMQFGYVASRFDMSLTAAYMSLRLPLAVALLALTLGSCLAPPLFARLVANPALVFLSGVSYNLYLWHQVIARALLDRHLPPFRTADPHDDFRWQIAYTALAWGASIAVAAVLTRLVETPFLRGVPSPWRLLRQLRAKPGTLPQ